MGMNLPVDNVIEGQGQPFPPNDPSNVSVCEAWDRLRTIRELVFEARSRSVTNTGWTGSGRGTVRVEQADGVTMLFHEKGSWTPEHGREITFNNVFRWTADPDGQLIRLEHLRFGPENPVYLFDLVLVSERVLESAEPHVCREDLYSARMEYDQAAVHLSWTITGPKKDERIAYSYK
jgi:hypothetical protein